MSSQKNSDSLTNGEAMTATPDKERISEQLQRNRKAYEKIRDKMESEHSGRFALMHDGELAGIHNDSGDVYSIGCDRFGLGNFSIESIGELPISLGIHDMCVSS